MSSEYEGLMVFSAMKYSPVEIDPVQYEGLMVFSAMKSPPVRVLDFEEEEEENDVVVVVVPPKNPYVGLMGLGWMEYRRLNDLEQTQDDEDDDDDILRGWEELVEIHDIYGHDLAHCYIRNRYPPEDIERSFARAIRCGFDPSVYMDAATYYKNQQNYDKMIPVCLQIIAIHKAWVFDAAMALLVHYVQTDHLFWVRYYYGECARAYDRLVEKGSDDEGKDIDRDWLVKHIHPRDMMRMVLLLEEEGDHGALYRAMHEAMYHDQQTFMRIYRTKQQLFQSLNHVLDCGVCLEVKVLHLALDCGHCVCQKCCIQLYDKPCPFCRHRSY